MSLYGPLAKMEEDRRRRNAEELNKKFQALIKGIDQVKKVSEDAGRAKQAIYESRKKPPTKKDMAQAAEAAMGAALPLGASKNERKAAKGKKRR